MPLIKNRRDGSVLIMFSIIMIIVLVASLAAYYWLTGWTTTRVRTNTRTGAADYIIDPPNKLNIMVMGADERPKEDDPGRSDTLLLLTLDTESREVSLISLPRDSRVRITGLGWDKIGHAFSYGGVNLSRHTVEDFLGVHVDYYAKVDLDSFGRIIDAIGGVTIDVEKRMQYEDTWDHFVIDLMPGVQRLDGRTALQYVRYRDEDGDIGRVQRQQKFIRALLSEVNNSSMILRAPAIIKEVSATLDTDMPLPLMLGIAKKLKDGLSTGLKANMVEGLPYYIDDISYWIPDIMKIRRLMAQLQGVPFTGATLEAAKKLDEEYRWNLPANAHLDDGSYYFGMDKDQGTAKDPKGSNQTKPKQQVTEKSPPEAVKPNSSSPNALPGQPGKDAAPPKKP